MSESASQQGGQAVRARDPLLERGPQLAAIDGLIADSLANEGRLALIEGPAGLGKTRLLECAIERASGSMRALSASASEFEREFPFGVVHQLFERELVNEGLRERALTGAAAPAGSIFGFGQASAEAVSGLSFAALHALYWMVLNLAEGFPLALAIDDLQHSDEQSLRFLSYLSRRLDGLPVLIVATWRSTDPGTNPGLISELAHAPGAVVLEPQPLSESGIGELIAARLNAPPDEAFGRACSEATGGNPLLVSELAAALEEEGVAPDATQAAAVRRIGPRALSRTVFARLSRLPVQAIEVARAIAVLGDDPAISVLASLTGLSEEEIAAAGRELERIGILRSGSELSFSHALIRDAVYADMPAADRQLAHTRAAAILRDAGATREAIATQLLQTAPPGEPWVAETLLEAGAIALKAGGSAAAAAYLARALEEPLQTPRRTAALVQLGFAQAPTDGGAAGGHLIEAYEATADPIGRGEIAIGAAQLLSTSSPLRAQEVLLDAVAGLPEAESDLRDELRALELTSWVFGGELDETWPDRILEFRRPPERRSRGNLILAATAAWDWAETGATARECSELALAAFADGRLLEINDTSGAMALWALTAAEHRDVERLVAQSVDHARRQGSLIAVATYASCQATLELYRGDLPGMIDSVIAARDGWEMFDLEDKAPGGYYNAMLALGLLARGDREGARRQMDASVMPLAGSSLHRIWLNSLIGVLSAEGRNEEVLETAAEYRRLFPRVTNPFQARWRSLSARALAALDRRDEALELVAEEVDNANAFGAPGLLARSLREAAEIEGSTDGLRTAVEVAEASTARLEQARALAAYGSALRRERKQTEAREPLRRALELASACGANAVAEFARSEIYASGARPRRDALSGVESLTTSERRVAELAAAGATNREIAQELYVTPKTVELHLTNTYRKLDLRSRRELPAALAPAGEPG